MLAHFLLHFSFRKGNQDTWVTWYNTCGVPSKQRRGPKQDLNSSYCQAIYPTLRLCKPYNQNAKTLQPQSKSLPTQYETILNPRNRQSPETLGLAKATIACKTRFCFLIPSQCKGLKNHNRAFGGILWHAEYNRNLNGTPLPICSYLCTYL